MRKKYKIPEDAKEIIIDKDGIFAKKRELVKMANGEWVIFNKYYPLEEINE